MFIIHSDRLELHDIRDALQSAKDNGNVASHVYFDTFTAKGSRTRKNAFHVHLGTETKDRAQDARGRMSLRRRPSNSRNMDELATYVASYAEWGFFIAEIFNLDPDAVVGWYKTQQLFHEYTRYAFI